MCPIPKQPFTILSTSLACSLFSECSGMFNCRLDVPEEGGTGAPTIWYLLQTSLFVGHHWGFRPKKIWESSFCVHTTVKRCRMGAMDANPVRQAISNWVCYLLSVDSDCAICNHSLHHNSNMGKLPHSVPNYHIQVSQGGDSDVMKL